MMDVERIDAGAVSQKHSLQVGCLLSPGQGRVPLAGDLAAMVPYPFIAFFWSSLLCVQFQACSCVQIICHGRPSLCIALSSQMEQTLWLQVRRKVAINSFTLCDVVGLAMRSHSSSACRLSASVCDCHHTSRWPPSIRAPSRMASGRAASTRCAIVSLLPASLAPCVHIPCCLVLSFVTHAVSLSLCFLPL